MVHLFIGSENFMSLSREVTVSWICEFNMFWYPFDNQICSMEFFVATDLVSLLPDVLNYTGSKYLAEYYVHNVQMCSVIIHGNLGVKVNIYLGRRIFNNLLTVFIPTIILILISHMANYFQKNYLDLVISTNLTVLLVLATL